MREEREERDVSTEGTTEEVSEDTTQDSTDEVQDKDTASDEELSDEQPDSVVAEKVERPVKYKPLDQYQREKTAWKQEKEELLQKVEEAKTSKGMNEKVTSFAKEHNLDANQLTGLVDIIKDEMKLPKEVLQGMEKMQTTIKQQEADKQVTADIDALALENPNEDIKKHATKLRKLAFTPEGANLSIYELYFRKIKPSLTGKKTAERGRGGTKKSVEGAASFEEAFNDDSGKIIKDMSLKEYEKFSKWLDNRAKAPLRRGGSSI